MDLNDDTMLATITPVDVEIDELSEEELGALAEQMEEERRQKEEMMESLANAINSKFQNRASKRAAKEGQWLRAAGLYYGKLSVKDYYMNGETPWSRDLESDRPDVNVVRSKCSIAIAQTVSMQFGTSNKNWDLFPDKRDPSAENAISCALMSDEIEGQLEDSKYSYNCRQAMWDRVVLGTGILKGPLSVGKLTRSYTQLDGSTTWVPSVSVDYSPSLVRINPWFFFPDESTNVVDKLNDTIEAHPLSPLDLKKYMKHEGFIEEALAKVLETAPEEYRSNTYAEFAKLSENNSNLFKDKYLVLEYHGPITRTQLDKMDIEPSYDSVNGEYYGEVWVCQNKVIRIELESIEASFRVPYYVCPWEKDPASVLGFGVPLMMEDAQRVVNESWHMILDNSSISSGPQVAMQKGLIEPANGKWELTPGQIWYLTDPQVQIQQALQFFNVPNVTQNIVPIMQMAQGFAEEESGIPLITAGLGSPQLADTASGGLMIQSASTTLLDFMSEDWDDNITEAAISSMYAWNMQNSEKAEIKGAFSIDVRTSTEYKNKQLHIRDLEKLSVEAAQNPEMAKYIRAGELARVRLNMMSLPSKSIIKSTEEVEADEAEAAANAQPDAEMVALQLKARQIALEEAQLAFEGQQQQQRELWDHEEKMTANQARLVESQARVAVSQNEKEIAMIELAAKNEQAYANLGLKEQLNRENNQTKAFLAGLENTRKIQENQLFEKELQLKREIGSGI